MAEPVQNSKIQEIRTRKYLATIHLLPDLRKKKSKEYLQVIFTFVALIIAAVFAINPTLTTISDLQREVSDANDVNQQLQTKINHLSQLNVQYNGLQTILPQIFETIPRTDEAHMFLAEMQGVLGLHHLTLTNIAANPAAATDSTNPAINVVSIQVTASGSYQDIRDFLSDVVTIQRIFTPQTIIISKVENKAGLLLTLNGNVYYFK